MSASTGKDSMAAEAVTRPIIPGLAVKEASPGRFVVDVPFTFPDGDHYIVRIEPAPEGWTITDEGWTFTNMSYRVDIDILDLPPLSETFSAILRESSATCEHGELQMTTSEENMPARVLDFCRLIQRVDTLRDDIREQSIASARP